MGKLTAWGDNWNKQFKPKIYQVRWRRQSNFFMTRVIFNIDIEWIAEIEGHHSDVEVSTDRIIGEDYDISILIEMNLGETII